MNARIKSIAYNNKKNTLKEVSLELKIDDTINLVQFKDNRTNEFIDLCFTHERFILDTRIKRALRLLEHLSAEDLAIQISEIRLVLSGLK